MSAIRAAVIGQPLLKRIAKTMNVAFKCQNINVNAKQGGPWVTVRGTVCSDLTRHFSSSEFSRQSATMKQSWN